MPRRTVDYVVAELAKKAGIEFPVYPHLLRHDTGFYLESGPRYEGNSSSIWDTRTSSMP